MVTAKSRSWTGISFFCLIKDDLKFGQQTLCRESSPRKLTAAVRRILKRRDLVNGLLRSGYRNEYRRKRVASRHVEIAIGLKRT